MNLKNIFINKAPSSHDLVLIGGGHSQITVLKKFGMKPVPGLKITLINKNSTSSYSGMIPGYIAGTYCRDDTQINLLNLCKFANARLITDDVTGIDILAKEIYLKNRSPIYYDTLSINSGGEPDINKIKGAKKYSIPIKPISNFIQVFDEIKNKIKRINKVSMTIIGGGAGGVEIALSLKKFLDLENKIEKNITLISKTNYLVSKSSVLTHRNALSLLYKNDVNVILNDEVVEFQKNILKTKDGKNIKSQFNFLVTSISAPKWISETKLKTTEKGFIEVNQYLQSNNTDIFAAGDICSIKNYSLSKAGVYAVRQGPILYKNLRSKILKSQFLSYKPQKYFLSLIGDGQKEAIISWGPISFRSKWAWKLKRYIDEGFIKKYNDLTFMKMKSFKPHPSLISKQNISDPALSEIKCLGCGAKTQWQSLNKGIILAKDKKNSFENSTILKNININSDVSLIKVPNGKDIIQSVDLISSIVNDPYSLSRIAALHSISDVLTSGADPVSAEAIFVLPSGLKEMQSRLISELISGCSSEFLSHNIHLNGGHTSEGEDLQVGFCITGIRPKNFVSLKPKVGDKLILTKPIGIGVVLAAHMRGIVNPLDYEDAVKIMLTSNQIASKVFLKNNITSITDVTGFGLARHALNLTIPFGAKININDTPVVNGAIKYLNKGVYSSLSLSNKEAIHFSGSIQNKDNIIFDPQTSGGLLAAVNSKKSNKIIGELKSNNCYASVIGEVVEKAEIVLN